MKSLMKWVPVVVGAMVVLTGCAGQDPKSTAEAAERSSSRTEEIVRSGDVQIEVTAEGDGPSVILLLSRGRDSYEYAPVAEGIAEQGFRVLRPQPRGIGDSAGPMDGITLHDLADDVAAVIEHEDNGPAVVVGHAYGHFVARTLAADHPELVRGVVIAAAGARNYPPHLSDLVTKSADAALPEQERLGYLQTLFFAPGHDASIWLDGWYPEVTRSQRAATTATDKNDWWPVAKQPILDLQAGQDPFRPRETVNELRDAFGDLVTVAVIPNASHAQIPEAPNAVVDEITQWLKTLPA